MAAIPTPFKNHCTVYNDPTNIAYINYTAVYAHYFMSVGNYHHWYIRVPYPMLLRVFFYSVQTGKSQSITDYLVFLRKWASQ